MVTFRIADEADTHTVSHLLAELFEEVGHTQTEDEIAEIFLHIDSDDLHSTLLALDDDGDAVGVITIVESIALYAGGRIGVINELYVVPAYRSEGVGKLLLDAVKDLAEQRGWVRIEVTTPGEEYAKTLRFYEREGFLPIGPRYKYMI